MAHLKRNSDGHLAKVASNHHLAFCGACDKNCWVRWEYDFCCNEIPAVGMARRCPDFFVVEVICTDTPPEYAGGWTFIGRIHGRCVYRYDQELTDCCSVAGDCPDPPDIPDIDFPTTDECCCVVCVYEWTATYTISDDSWAGPTQGTARCLEAGAVGTVDQWVYLGTDGTTCRYRYRTIGSCCDSDGDCTAWPSDPSLPGTPFECGTCNAIPCRLRVTIAGTTPVCTSNVGFWFKPQSNIDGSYVVSTVGSTVFPGIAADIFSDADCTTSIGVSTTGTATFDNQPAYPTIEQIDAGATYPFDFIWIDTSGFSTPNDTGFGVRAIAGTITAYDGECCGYPTMIQVDIDDQLGVSGGTVTIELLDCPLPCASITAIFSGFVDGSCGTCAAINGSVDITASSGCVLAGEQVGTGNSVGINWGVDATTGLGFWTLTFSTACGDFVWRADADPAGNDCPPTGGWSLITDPGTCGSPAVSLSY